MIAEIHACSPSSPWYQTKPFGRRLNQQLIYRIFYIMFQNQWFEAVQKRMCFSSKKCPPAHPLRVLRACLERVWRFAGLYLRNQEDPSWASTSISHPMNTSSVSQPEEMYSSTHSTQPSITLHIGMHTQSPHFYIYSF